MGISSPGIGSGLDVKNIISQLVAAEGQPTQMRLDSQEAKIQAKISAFGQLNNVLADWRSNLNLISLSDNIEGMTFTSSDNSISGTANSSAVVGSYTLAVTQMAQADKLLSPALPDAYTPIGTGTLVIKVGSDQFSVVINENNNTFNEMVDAINTAPGNHSVSASVLNTNNGAQLVLSGTVTGQANAMSVTVTNDGDLNNTDNFGLSRLVYDPTNSIFNMTNIQPAQDAIISIDGQPINNSSNTFSNTIDQVTFTINQVPTGTVTMQVQHNTTATSNLINDFVSKYNTFVQTINQLTAYDPNNNQKGDLLGDATVRMLETQLQNVLTADTGIQNNAYENLTQIGISMNDDGTLSLDQSQLNLALQNNYVAVGKLFSDVNTGIGNTLYDLVNDYIGFDGMITTQVDEYQDKITEIDDARLNLSDHLIEYENRLRQQFGALDALMNKFHNLSNYLSAQFENLPGFQRKDK